MCFFCTKTRIFRKTSAVVFLGLGRRFVKSTGSSSDRSLPVSARWGSCSYEAACPRLPVPVFWGMRVAVKNEPQFSQKRVVIFLVFSSWNGT
jgi:hypothetical protein